MNSTILRSVIISVISTVLLIYLFNNHPFILFLVVWLGLARLTGRWHNKNNINWRWDDPSCVGYIISDSTLRVISYIIPFVYLFILIEDDKRDKCIKNNFIKDWYLLTNNNNIKFKFQSPFVVTVEKLANN